MLYMLIYIFNSVIFTIILLLHQFLIFNILMNSILRKISFIQNI